MQPVSPNASSPHLKPRERLPILGEESFEQHSSVQRSFISVSEVQDQGLPLRPNKTHLSDFQKHSSSDHDYCSQERKPVPFFRSIEEGIRIIEEILGKNILCRHDVLDLNQAYLSMDLLERQIEKIPERNSAYVLKKVVERVKEAAPHRTSRGLICLYHMQNFADPELKLAVRQLFSASLEQSKVNPKDLATDLPCCSSEKQFDTDIASLGHHLSDSASQILGEKKEKLRKHENIKQEIASRKIKLEELRKSHPQNYPPYLDELLDCGYIHLYDYLLQMKALPNQNDRRAETEKMSFSTMSHIVLEAREAVIQKVENSIPSNRHNILCLLGNTKTGKSTTLCFLRGDPMVLRSSEYHSQSEKSRIIGHEGAISCTFLPTVEIVDDLIIIDFPGFDDTHGLMVSIGIEFALKGLIKKFKLKMLVLEAITNNEGGFTSAARLGRYLSRVLNNQKLCRLGLTKYSKDPDFIKIRAIEEQQRKEQLAPTTEEEQLIGGIQALQSLNMPELEPKIREKQLQLEKMQRDRAQKQHASLPDTPPKTESTERLKKREDEFLNQIGLTELVRFTDLENPQHRSSCLQTLSQTQPVSIHLNPALLLDADHVELLDRLFRNNLMEEMKSKKNYQIKDFKFFMRSVLETSLIGTFFSQSHPEIGQFLHLPEIDPTLVRKYDKEVVSSTIKQVIELFINTLNLSHMNEILKEWEGKVPKEKLDSLRGKMERLRDYIMGLSGSLPEDMTNAAKKWEEIRAQHRLTLNAIEKQYQISSPLINALYWIPLGIPHGILTLMKWSAQNTAMQKAILDTLESSCKEMDQMYDTLLKLKEIETLIQRKDAIDKAFNSVPISMESIPALHAAIIKRIHQVRDVYGSEEWDKRVSFLANQFLLNNFDPKNSSHAACLSAYAYLLIEPDMYAKHDRLGKLTAVTEIAVSLLTHPSKEPEVIKKALALAQVLDNLLGQIPEVMTEVRRGWLRKSWIAERAFAREPASAQALVRAQTEARTGAGAFTWAWTGAQAKAEALELVRALTQAERRARALTEALEGIGKEVAQAEAQLLAAELTSMLHLELTEVLKLADLRSEVLKLFGALSKIRVLDELETLPNVRSRARDWALMLAKARAWVERLKEREATLWALLVVKQVAPPKIRTRLVEKAAAIDGIEKESQFFRLFIENGYDQIKIEIFVSGDMPEFAQGSPAFFRKELPLTRALSAAALLKANKSLWVSNTLIRENL